MAGKAVHKAATGKPAAARAGADESGHLLERMLFLSDAVFAIVMTLLALELQFPPGYEDGTLVAGLVAMAPKLIAFAISFAVLSVFWIGHAAMTRSLVRFDWVVAWLNLLFLFTLTGTPFATGLLGEFGPFGNAWRVYCLALIAIGAAQVALVAVICRGGGALVGGVSRREAWRRMARAASPGLGFLLALALSLMGFAVASQISWVSIPLFLLAARWLLGPKNAKAG